MSFDPEQHFSLTPLEPVLELARKTVIVVATWNRRKTVEICLNQVADYKLGSSLWIYDDGSDEYDEEFLWNIGDKVYRQPHGIGGREGVKKLRSFITKSVLYPGYRPHDEWLPQDFPDGIEYIYHIDSDVFHDPWFFYRIYEITQTVQDYGAICLYNPKFRMSSRKQRSNPRTFPDMHTVIRTSGYGCSLFFRKQSFLDQSEHIDVPEGGVGWDLHYSATIARARIAMSSTSYVEHFGYGGMHNDDDNQKTRAMHPTLYLSKTRSRIIKALGDVTGYYSNLE